MISQSCPRCHSQRVRRGYRPTPLWLKILFRYNLLCDKCNWEFRGFAVPGTVSSRPNSRHKSGGKSKDENSNSSSTSLGSGDKDRRDTNQKVKTVS